MSPLLNAGLAFVFLLSDNFERCIHQALTAIEVDPSMILGYFMLGNAYEQKGQYAQAIEAYEKGIASGGPIPFYKTFIGHVYGNSGEAAKAWGIVQDLKEFSKTCYVPHWYSAVVYDGLGERELAIEALQQSYENRETMLVFLKTCPQNDRFRDDPRFQEIERRVGLRE
jgi:tetratricopeptide (TPR) repeat protein